MASLNDSDFEIFGLPCQFEIDSAALGNAYLNLQNQTHPDRFANASAQEKRLAVQWTTRINEAYKRLSNPVERAIYWCELQGEDPRGRQSNLPADLLMQQMEWREALEDAGGVDDLDELLTQVRAEKQAKLTEMAARIDHDRDAKAATQTAQALLFIDKFLLELNKRIEILEDAS